MKKRLPIGIQTFENIIKEGWLYIDKTPIILDLLENGAKYNFISRPRRFGKSLIVSTLQSIFEGKKELFNGLHIYDKRDFEANTCPVIKISRGTGVANPNELEPMMNFILDNVCRENKVDVPNQQLPRNRFAKIIQTIYDQTGKKVVILVDEYDKPILDNINKPEEAKEVREGLKSFYSVIKDSDQYIKFVFITGVSKFSKVSLFSGLNNLKDLTLDPKMGEICGFTDDEITEFLPDYLEGIDRKKMKLRYNGFNFLGHNKVYNPFDVLLFLDMREYKNYRFETATPTFLVQIMQKDKQYFHIPDLMNIQAGEDLLGSFDVENIKIETLLFQAGYLTIKNKYNLGGKINFDLQIPNLEVKTSLTTYFLSDYLKVKDLAYQSKITRPIYKALQDGNIENLIQHLKVMFSGIAYSSIQHLTKYEGYYSSVIYTLFYSMGIEVIQEDITSMGRIDLTVKFEGNIFVIEFKVEKTGPKAMEQINIRKYTDKYLGQGQVFKLGINFSFEDRNIESWESEKM